MNDELKQYIAELQKKYNLDDEFYQDMKHCTEKDSELREISTSRIGIAKQRKELNKVKRAIDKLNDSMQSLNVFTRSKLLYYPPEYNSEEELHNQLSILDTAISETLTEMEGKTKEKSSHDLLTYKRVGVYLRKYGIPVIKRESDTYCESEFHKMCRLIHANNGIHTTIHFSKNLKFHP